MPACNMGHVCNVPDRETVAGNVQANSGEKTGAQ